MDDLTDLVERHVGEVRTESLDISFGELISLFEQKELIIQPEYQRLFRWSTEQKSRLVESLLLEFPIPQIFVIELETGVFELIDGLQRISSVIQFVNSQLIALEPLRLQGCDVVSELDGSVFDDLPLTLKLRLKRSVVRMVIIKRQSNPILRYEMFKRLNTGGTRLSDQDIRNVNARMFGDRGVRFYELISTLSTHPGFTATTETLSQSAREQRGDEELVLRFLALVYGQSLFKGNISEWLDEFMYHVISGHIAFDEDAARSTFNDVFSLLAEKFGPAAFTRFRNGLPLGGLAPAYFEAVSAGTLRSMPNLAKLATTEAVHRLATTVESDEFRAVTGPGANSREKLQRRIDLIATTFGQ